MSLGPAEILVIFVVALLVFGPTRLPEVGRQVGRGMKEIKKFQQTLKGDFEEVLRDDSSAPSTATPASGTSTAAPSEPAPTLPPNERAAPGAGRDPAPNVTSHVTTERAAPSEAPPTNPPA